jgi:hypothetical protein
MAAAVKTLEISKLVPFERGLVSHRLEAAKRLLAANKDYLKDMPAVEIIEVDGGYVVGDGTHRVAAALAAGKEVVPVKYRWKDEQAVRPYRDALSEHLPLQGFADMPVCASEAERQALPLPIRPDA